MTDNQKKALEMLKNRGLWSPPSIREIGRTIGLSSPRSAHLVFKALEKQGLVEKKGRHWFPLETNSKEYPTEGTTYQGDEETVVINGGDTRQHFLKVGDKVPYAREDGRCHDCGCLLGEKHYDGCDVEECPVCHKQLLSCIHHIVPLDKKIPFGKETR